VAYRNVLQGVKMGETARRYNPYREFVGAQIRGDCYGYVSPGRPEQAAALAYRDATVSHVRNGVYGAMWVAALLASVPAVEGLKRAVQVGLTEVPEASRLANCVTEVLGWHAAGASYETAVDRIHAEWDDADLYEGYHVLPNAQVVAAALVWAGEDPDVGTAFRRAVSAGFDTDCNAATVGSAVGLQVGHDHLPEQWVRPTSAGVRTALADRPRPELNDLAAETAALANA
jgi:ADP-ribosylglycohydrolase.